MITKNIKALSELNSIIDSLNGNFLFRGQVKHFENDEGNPSFKSSFKRNGCIPSIMFKWSHYTRAIIRAFSTDLYEEISLEKTQALLQHYGWRSFYIDVTKSYQIACWFAFHEFNQNRTTHMSKDWQESAVRLDFNEASYKPTSHEGHLFILNADILKINKINIYDLGEIAPTDFNSRYEAQKACLLGPLHKDIPEEAIAFHLVIDHLVLEKIHHESSINTVEDLFPNATHDKFLEQYRKIPWERIPIVDSPIPRYRRGLELPEYEVTYTKHLNPKIPLFALSWIAHNVHDKFTEFQNVPFILISEVLFYYGISHSFQAPLLDQLLNKYQSVIIEYDNIMNIPEYNIDFLYEKGVVISKKGKSQIEVRPLNVRHPGQNISMAWTTIGWHYTKDSSNNWSRMDDVNDCPCNNTLRHQLHFSVIEKVEELFASNEIQKKSKLLYQHQDVTYYE